MTSVGKLIAAASAWLVCVLFVTSCGRVERAPEPKLTGRDFRTVVYTEEFRQRFSLQDAGVQKLDSGLQAIALRLEVSPYRGTECFLDLYLDDSLDVDYPEGTAGRFGDTTVYGRMFFMNQLSGGDSAAIDKRWLEPRWMYRSAAYGEGRKRGVMESGPIAEYDRALVPGLSVVTLRVVPWLLEPNEAPAKLWLRKRGAPVTALDVSAPNSEQTYAFTMPVALLRHAAEATRHAARNPAHPGPSGHFPEPQYSLPPR